MEKQDFKTRFEAAKKKKTENVKLVVNELKTMYEAETGKAADYVFVL